jgi:16S rRNA (guanine527-N7)-methyltransferase
MQPFVTLERLAGELGLTLDAVALDRFRLYADLLLDWNQRMNLTRVTGSEEIQVKLFADALALMPFILRYQATHERATRLKLIDVGSGAGFPGLPLKIVCPDLDVTLVEATGKKVRFLEAVVTALGLEAVTALHGRAEDLAHRPDLRGRFDIVVARAVARLPALLELSLAFCRVGGLGLFPKGVDAAAEAAESAAALKTLRARLIGIEPVALPELAGTVIVAVEQVGKPPSEYPRRPGIPAKHPLSA